MTGVQHIDDKLGPPIVTVDGEAEARTIRRPWRYVNGPTITDLPATGEQEHDFAAVVTAGPLVTETDRGVVSPMGAVVGSILTGDPGTPGGVWQNEINIQAGAVTSPGNPTYDLGTNTVDVDILRFGTAPPSLGSMRWSDHTTVRGLDHAGTGEAQLMDWGDTIADHLTIGSNDADLDGVDIVGGATGTVDVRVGAATNLRVSATTVSTPANAIWSLGTHYVTHGAAPATAGSIRLTDTDNVTWLNGGNNYALCSGQGTTACLGGPYPTRPTTALVDAATTSALQVGGTSILSCTSSAVAVGAASVAFGSTLVTPTISQTADSTASVTCDDTIYTAQSATNAAGGASAARSGVAVLAAPTAGGHADNYDGNVALVSAPAANLSTLGAEKCCFFGKAVAAPTLPPTNGHIIYVDPTTENFMALGESNTLTTLALK
jgi:hypothetical protein